MSGFRLGGWVGLLVIVAVTVTATARMSDVQRQAILAEAQESYDRGVALLRDDDRAARQSFDEAATRFRQLVDDGVENGRLHYNLGNAYLQSGQLGRAILHYRWAQTLMPGDPELEHNLGYARSLRRSAIAPGGRRALADALFGWHERISERARAGVFLFGWALGWILLAVDRVRSSAWLRWTAGVAAAVALIAGASVAVSLFGDGRDRIGVVIRDDVAVRKGNGEGFELQFEEPLHQGVELTILDRRPGWLFVELVDGSRGWIRADQAGVVGEPKTSRAFS